MYDIAKLCIVSFISLGCACFKLNAQPVDPGELSSGRFAFISYDRGVDIASGWFQITSRGEISIEFSYPRAEREIGSITIDGGQTCFSVPGSILFPVGCGNANRFRILFPNDVHLWFANAKGGAFLDGDGLALRSKLYERERSLRAITR